MKLYLDTSSLFKLYHQEAGTGDIERIFEQEEITHVFLSELAKVEFTSTVWKKVRTKEITIEQARITLGLFERDFEKYNFIVVDSLIMEHARDLVTLYGREGLRTLDSIQLSTCIALTKQVDLFISVDQLLKKLIEQEGLNTKLRN